MTMQPLETPESNLKQPTAESTPQTFEDVKTETAPGETRADDASSNVENTEKPKRGKKPKKKKSLKREILEWVLTLAAAVAIALLIRTFVFEPFRVEGSSMADTLHNGEIMFVTKFDYLAGDPDRFDVVICHYPNRTEDFVKRVVGLPGDTVSVSGGLLTVNDVTYDEPYLTHRPDYTLKPYTVPEGMYFVLGDNRSNSNDSHIIGPIKRAQIIGHVRSVMFPFNAWRGIE